MNMQIRTMLPIRTTPGQCLPLASQGFYGPMHRFELLWFQFGKRIRTSIGRE